MAICTDGVGTKLIVAEQMGRFDTVGIDCIAMNVNDVVCVGAEPIALVDYVAVEEADEAMLAAIGEGLQAGAEAPGSRSPAASWPRCRRCCAATRRRAASTCVGTASAWCRSTRSSPASGSRPATVVGVPSSGVHSNGYTLARGALRDLARDRRRSSAAARSPTSCWSRP